MYCMIKERQMLTFLNITNFRMKYFAFFEFYPGIKCEHKLNNLTVAPSIMLYYSFT